MPDQNNNQSLNPASSVVDIPPFPPGIPKTDTNKAPTISSIVPKKRPGGGRRIIITLLGILLLVGGVGAGLILTQQQQIFQPKAGSNCCKQGSTKSCTIGGKAGTAHCVSTDPDNCIGQVYKGAWGGCQANSTPKPDECKPVCAGKNCGQGDGCGGTCQQSSGCNYCSSATNSFCSVYGGCAADSNGGHCNYGPGTTPPPGTGGPTTCGAGLECSQTPISGAVKCTQNNSQVPTTYCCPAGKHIDTNAQGVKQCAAANICGGNVCSFPKTCQNNQCVYPDNTTCGRNTDQNAPVCCDSATKANCANKVCEPPNRLECVINGVYCTIDTQGCNPNNPTNPPGATAQCNRVQAYDSSFTALTGAQLSKLKPGTKVNFCVGGTASSGSFDKAKFTITVDGTPTTEPETTTKGQGPAASMFCQNYAIPATGTSFNVKAQIHHATLGWSN